MKKRVPLYALILSGVVSNFGNTLTSLAIPWFVLETTNSPSAAGITAFFSIVPVVLAGLLGGPIIDRMGYKRVSIVSDLLSGVTVALIPLLHHTVGLQFWQLQVLVFLGAFLDAPGGTARGAIIPELSQEAEMPLERTQSIRQVANQLAQLCSPLVGGVLIALVGASNLLWVNAATFLVSAAAIAFGVPARLVPAPAEAEGSGLAGYGKQLVEGLQFIRTDRVVLVVVLVSALANFVLGQLDSVLLPTYGNQILNNPTALGTIMSVFSAGALIGGALFGVVGPRLSRRAVYLGSFALQAVALLGWALLPPLPFMVAFSVLFGFAFGPVSPLLGTLGAERVPPDMRGRVFGMMDALGWIAMPLGPLVGGFTVEAVGLQPTFLTLAVIYAGLSFIQFFSRSLRDMDRPTGARGPQEASD